MLDNSLDREMAEYVHGLTGGEADDALWHGFLCHDDLPDWHESLPDEDTRDGQKVTLRYCTIYSDHPHFSGETLSDNDDEEAGGWSDWTHVTHYACSGETDCWMIGMEDGYLDGPSSCLYCESLVMEDSHHYELGTRDEHPDPDWFNADMSAFVTYSERRRGDRWGQKRDLGHGYIYIGDCFQAIYSQASPVCHLCEDDIEQEEIESAYDCACGLSHDGCASEVPEPSICGGCSGSGEGMYDGSKCSSCKGSGEHQEHPHAEVC